MKVSETVSFRGKYIKELQNKVEKVIVDSSSNLITPLQNTLFSEDSNNKKDISFGMKFSSSVINRTNAGKKTLDIIELDNGKSVVISTNYAGKRITDKVLTLWDEKNKQLKAVIKQWFSGSKRPNTLVIDEKTLNKLDKFS